MPHKVLVIDDSEDIHDLVRVGLVGEPVMLQSYFDGASALAAARAHLPDLILLDVDMPGTDGFEVCRLAKADPQLSHIPVVFLTGASSAAEKLRGLDLGAIDYVTKPFDPIELRARVRAALRTKGLMDRLAHEAVNLRAQSQVLRMIARDAPLADVQGYLVTMAQGEYPGSVAAIFLLRNGALQLVAPGLPQAARDRINEHIVKLTASLCSPLASSNETFGDCSIAHDPRWEHVRPVMLQANLSHCWHSLLRSGDGDVLGMFCLCHPAPVPPDDAARASMEKFGTLMSIAADHRHLTEQLEHRAQHDVLTGLPNRSLLDERLRQTMREAQDSQRSVGVIFVDVDRFKLINDTMGHFLGDLLLCQMAERLRQAISEAGILARLGGDEFAIVLPQVTGQVEAVRVGQRILDAMKTPFQIAAHELFVTVSLGLCLFPQDGSDTVTLKKNADTAMYRAKNSGRNNLRCFDHTMEESVNERLDLENALRRACDAGDLALHYQPQVDRTGKVVCVEALLRWHDPVRGPISPAQFIPLAEESGLIIPIGAWVLREAARQAREWRSLGVADLCVAVNVSMLQFVQADFVELVQQAIHDYQIMPGGLELELTESLLMKNASVAAEKLRQLKSLGVSLAIDDFGTGYSSLAYLRRLPVDSLKIDRSFVASIQSPDADRDEDRAADEAVVRAITSMSHSLRKVVVAEGVETEAQRLFLANVGCDRMQGYLFGRPVPAPELLRLLTPPAALRKAS